MTMNLMEQLIGGITQLVSSELIVEDFVWFGVNSVVLNSVRKIGKGSIIAAGAVVTKDVPERSIVAGVPAKVVALRNIDENE